MIIIRYCGGLGNQMYQYALQCVLEELYPEQEIKINKTHYYLFHEHNGFEIDQVFGLTLTEASRNEIKKVYSGFVPRKWQRNLPMKVRKFIVYHYQPLYNKVCNFLFKKKRKYLVSGLGHNIYNDAALHLTPSEHWYFNGLWQNVRYFQGYEEKICARFRFKRQLLEEDRVLLSEIQSNVKSVSIHVRRGDFVGSKFDLCGKKYYQKAIEYLKERLEDPFFYIFTDDKKFVEQEFSDLKNKKMISHTVEESDIDMLLMSNCHHNIISNSTFSFWGSFLNPNKDKLVVCPKYSIKDNYASYELSVPSDWIRVE